MRGVRVQVYTDHQVWPDSLKVAGTTHTHTGFSSQDNDLVILAVLRGGQFCGILDCHIWDATLLSSNKVFNYPVQLSMALRLRNTVLTQLMRNLNTEPVQCHCGKSKNITEVFKVRL